jgi:hypothetical protein
MTYLVSARLPRHKDAEMDHRARVRQGLPYALAALLVVGGPSCVIQSPEVRSIPLSRPTVVDSPVKAHLRDGSTVVFPRGVTLVADRITGVGGVRFPLGATGTASNAVPGGSTGGVFTIPLDSIVGMEAYSANVNVPGSVAASIAGGFLGTVGAVALAIALFGSCPTFYADSSGVELLQGEGFSYSVAPLLEQRDVDRLRLAPGTGGNLVLTVKNEALETHYINFVEVIEARHRPGEVVLPDQGGRPVAVSGINAVTSVRDRSGRNIASDVNAADSRVFSTPASTLDGVSESDLDDWIDIEIPVKPGADSVAIVMEMRNSLLNTVLLYDHILAAPGIKSLDFLGKDLENISGAVALAKWYSSHMGMRIAVRDGDAWRRVARIGDSGPIAFHQLAVMVPAVTNGGTTVKVRLAFVADDWRIDAIRAGTAWRRPETRRIAPSRLVMMDSAQNEPARKTLLEPDDRYLITSPGNAFKIVFDVGPGTSSERTYMLATQGYYTEWVRGSWIKNAKGVPFSATNTSLLAAINGWRVKQHELEKQFYSSRIAAGR